MYVPKHFAISEIDDQFAVMAAIGAATLVSQTADGLTASHVPVELLREPAPCGSIRCHLARANPHAKALADGAEVLAIFTGPQGYISPSHYPSKQTNAGKVVPTWNYVTLHAYGTVRLFEGEDALRPHLEALTDRHEAGRGKPWAVSDAPEDFVAMLTRAIVGLEIRLTRIEGKAKMSQNRPAPDRLGMVAGLLSEGREDLVAAARRFGAVD